MSIALELTPAEHKRLREAAQRRGVKPEVLAHDLVVDFLPESTSNGQDPFAALFDKWAAEDASMTEEERAKEHAEWEQFKNNLNAERDRAGSRRLF